jgi:hypothetical protein
MKMGCVLVMLAENSALDEVGMKLVLQANVSVCSENKGRSMNTDLLPAPFSWFLGERQFMTTDTIFPPEKKVELGGKVSRV